MLFLVVMLTGAAAQAAERTILIYGDSLSAGYGIAQEHAWPTLLAQRLQREYPAWRVVNASISGETSAGGRSRINDALARHKPAILVLELGANDGLRGLSLKQMRDNLEAIITRAQATGARVMVIGMRMPPNFGQAYTEKFQATFSELARQHKTALLPFLMEGFAEKRALFQTDGIHPGTEAQKLLLENVWPVLRPMLKN